MKPNKITIDSIVDSLNEFQQSTDPFDPLELHVSIPFDFHDFGIEMKRPVRLVMNFVGIPIVEDKYLPIGTSVLLNMKTGEVLTITSKKS